MAAARSSSSGRRGLPLRGGATHRGRSSCTHPSHAIARVARRSTLVEGLVASREAGGRRRGGLATGFGCRRLQPCAPLATAWSQKNGRKSNGTVGTASDPSDT